MLHGRRDLPCGELIREREDIAKMKGNGGRESAEELQVPTAAERQAGSHSVGNLSLQAWV